MTVQNTIVKNVYVGNGSTTVFPFTFECNKAEHIQAFVKDAAGNITSTTNFKVDLEQKNLTYPNTGEPLAKGDKLIILRQLPLQQLLNLLNQGPFYAEDIEETFDEVVMMLQQMTEHIGRSLAVSVDIDSENSFNTIIPLEAGKTFRVKDDGTGFEVTEDPGKVIDGAKALLKLTTEQAELAKEQAAASSQSAVSAQNAANAAEAVAPEYAKTKEVLDNIVSYTNTATAQANIATAKADAASTSAANAAQSYTNADSIATQLTEYLATKETLTAPAVDKTLLIEGAAADSKVVGELKSDLGYLTTKMQMIKSDNKLSSLIDGYCDINGNVVVTNGYKHTNMIAVNKGDIARSYCVMQKSDGYTFVLSEMRFVTCYNSNKNPISSSGSSSSIREFTVPDGVAYISATLAPDYQNDVVVTINKTINEYIAYFEPYWIATDDFLPISLRNYNSYKVVNKKYIKVFKGSTNENETVIVCNNIDNRKNSIIECWFNFENFTSINIGHGTNKNYANFINVTNEKINLYGGALNTKIAELEHGLTINGFLHILIEQNDKAQAKIKITTASGSFETDNLNWNGCEGSIFCTTLSATTNLVILATFKDLDKDVFIFGDSYTNIGSDTRYPKYLIDDGYDNFLMCGFGGAKSSEEISSFNNILKIAKPKVAVWCLGMNDADTTSAINSSWLECVNHFINECNSNRIIPILATIPNTPTINHTYKNDFVRNSGYRYIDFAKAVNAENQGSTWYDGMLNTADNVHPLQLGAKALASRVIIDLPEIIS